MTVRAALRHALHDLYEQSWRLALLNTALSAVVLAVLALASYAPIALVLGIGIGPLLAALMHCAVCLVRDGELRFATAIEGVRVAVRSYGSSGAFTWPLAFVAAYLLAFFLVLQLVLWPLAVAERERPLRGLLADAGTELVRRPAASMGLALALLLINALGAAAAVLPLLTVTVAYSFVAAARFALPSQLEEGPL